MLSEKIVVIDDDPRVIKSLKMALSEYEIVDFTDGYKAVSFFRKPRDINLVLLDVMMPGIDGYHLVYKITTVIDGPIPKIIIISSRDAEQDKHVGEQSGADAQLQKPFDMPCQIRMAWGYRNKPNADLSE